MRDEKGRAFLGVAVGEQDFAFYPEVIRLVEWIEDLTGAEPAAAGRAASHKTNVRKTVPLIRSGSSRPQTFDSKTL